MIDRTPLNLRPEDRAEDDARTALSLVAATPRDPQADGIELMRLSQQIAADALALTALFERWGDDPVAVMHKAQGRTLEIREQALRLPDQCERLMKACRAAGVFSSFWRRPVGGR